MDEKLEARVAKLKTIRLEDGNPIVWEHENPVLNLQHAIVMAQRAGLLYRFFIDGRDFEFRITEPMTVQKCSMVQAPEMLCGLVEEAYFPVDAEVEEWEPTPEYAAELEGPEDVPEAPE